MADGLTDKQARFVQEYLIDCNGTQAAIRAGYSKRTARDIAAENLAKPNIAEAIAKRQAKVATKAEVTQEWVIAKLRQAADECLGDGDKRNAAAGIKAVELLGKHLGMMVDRQQVEQSGTLTVEIEYVNDWRGRGRSDSSE